MRSLEAASEKIIVAGMCKRLECYYDTGGYIAGKSTSIVLDSKLDLKFLLAVLNSKLISFFYEHYFRSTALNGGYFNIHANQLKEIPIAFEERIAAEIIKNVIRIFELQEQNKSIETIDRQIDNMVYSLYRLDLEEIGVVEGCL